MPNRCPRYKPVFPPHLPAFLAGQTPHNFRCYSRCLWNFFPAFPVLYCDNWGRHLCLPSLSFTFDRFTRYAAVPAPAINAAPSFIPFFAIVLTTFPKTKNKRFLFFIGFMVLSGTAPYFLSIYYKKREG